MIKALTIGLIVVVLAAMGVASGKQLCRAARRGHLVYKGQDLWRNAQPKPFRDAVISQSLMFGACAFFVSKIFIGLLVHYKCLKP